ncbi:hypothetical protein P3T36_000736 [Kitasatospora sp. MAP12-15]|uniref:thiocillin family RiPP n=1 Tax=unclassified Kitasatospora TaxID=2633591 RepID=UPI002473B1A8|nr:thiocillin family RiPP [Kitasatospora sp. MAP12-44]MDH6114335.1 hypothetical protein [Kitasatospora sp. MAP12-44]
MDTIDVLDLFAEEGEVLTLTAEPLASESLLGTWGSFGSLTSASCPASTAGSSSSASSAG